MVSVNTSCVAAGRPAPSSAETVSVAVPLWPSCGVTSRVQLRVLVPQPADTVTPGQEIKTGEPLAVVEAMKMENVLRAERDGRIARIRARPGDSLAVDQVILEFE